MLPSVVASELEQVAADAIRTAFHPTTPGFAGLIERFLADRERLLKGPYISISLPFRKGQRADWFPELRLPFTPWRHQEQAFTRLSPGSPQNTLVATGTGSGKTECFLYPALDHCRLAQQNGQRGVKVILIYPMNALATDQAKRIAQIIHTTPALAGVRAGLYIGDQEEQSALAMGPEQVITDRASLHQAPPDILLTNYKQLDYLLLQPHAQGLWAHNGTSAEGTSVLRYLVVDEFHTFDGAQGTDLACLIRRLRHRLHAQGEQLICVGTSATLGDGDSQAEMLHYAGQIFGCGFSRDALIQESRLRPAEFFEETALSDPKQGLLLIPPPALEQQPLLDPASYGGASGRTAATAMSDGVRLAYLAAQVPLWFGAEFPLPASGDLLDPAWRIELGRQLGRLPAAQNLVRQAHQLCSLQELLERFAKQLGIDGRYPLRFRILLLESLLALIAHARAPDGRPWVQLRVQLWLRELKRMVATVAPTPELLHSDDLTGQEDEKHLPVVHCRDCGATGWTSTLLHQNASQLDPARNLRNFYRAFFARDPLVRYVFPLRSLADSPAESEPLASAERLFCRDCLTIQDPPRSSCASSATPVLAPCCQSCSSTNLVVAQVPEITVKDSNGHLRSSSDCPSCGAHRSLLLIGATAASLTSSCAASLFASSFNSDRKLLTFSDSVQDAAHRAGFIAARAYRTTFRTALTATLQATGHDLSLPALQDALIAHWQRQLDPLDFVATFLPSDLEWLKEWAEIEQSRQPLLPPDSPLPGIVEKRLRWEVIAEFGYRSRLGSSLEQAGSLAAGLDPARLESVLAALLPRLINEVEGLPQLEANRLRRFLVGWLQHLRQRGAIPVPELLGATGGSPSRYLSSGGIDTFPFKLIQHLPNLGPSSNKPVFLTSARGRGHFEPIASLKGRPTWAMRWLLRSLGLPPLPEALAAKPQVSDPATAHGTLTPDPSPASSFAAESIAIALQLAVEELERGGLLQALPQGQGGERLWGIPPDAVLVDGDLTPMRCERCGDSQAIRSRDRALWEEMPCLVSGCLGQYVAEPQAGGSAAVAASACRRGEEGFHNAICPRCGDANFCDAHQVKEMARLRQVIATSDDALSRISDDRDDRSPTFFQRQLLVIPDLNRVEITLAVPDGDFPFGAEFLAATTFREINFGALNPIGSGHQIAGQQFRVRGFELCGSCGKVLKGKPHSNQHAYSCNYRNDPENAKARQLLFLYREFSSEALRFLLPDRLFWDDSGQNSFQAALNLGLKRHFSGRVDHLQAAIANEPQPGSTPSSSGGNQRKTFLYLYDAVPGGTGYLCQLVENGGERLRQVLEDARSALQACSCHDGCYRCLYAYRSRFQRDRTSKERALAQLQLLQDRWSQLQSSSRSLTSVAITNQTESELEERFLDALREGKAAPAGMICLSLEYVLLEIVSALY